MIRKIITVMLVCAISASVAAASGPKKQLTGVVNINTATAGELALLPGIGKAKADAICAERQKTPFKSVGDLKSIKGIGDKMIAKLQPFVVVDGPTTAKVVKVQTPAAATAVK